MTEKTSDRSRRILRAVVWEYIRSGRPIGSRALAKTTGLNLSPATLRNAMADLEEAGLLQSPHTSAGRLPSTDGIRFFVDSILTMRPPDESTRALLRENMRGETSSDLLRAALDSLLAVTRFAGFVAIPAREPPRLAKIQFVKLGARRVMPVLLTVDGEIVNRVIELAQDADIDDLNVAADFLNRAFYGRTLEEAKNAVSRQVADLRSKIRSILSEMIEVLSTDTAPEMRVSGERNLVGSAEMPADIDRLRRLFTTLEKKRDLLRLIEETGRADDLQLFIGSECGNEALADCSVVFSACSDEDGKKIGVIGVIGPKRMKYERVMPLVDVTAKLVGAAASRLRRDFSPA